MTAFEIPASNKQQQRFVIALAGVDFGMRLHWCAPMRAWVLDISDANGTLLAAGLPLITGADLLAQFAYLGFGGRLIVQSDDDVDAVPQFETLGTLGHLYFVTP
jgi:hypothetical protein